MKKFLLIGLATVFFAMTLSFSACDGGSHSHVYGSWKSVKDADCTTQGKMSRSCQECGDIEEIDVDPLGHNFVDGKCTVCGEQENE